MKIRDEKRKKIMGLVTAPIVKTKLRYRANKLFGLTTKRSKHGL